MHCLLRSVALCAVLAGCAAYAPPPVAYVPAPAPVQYFDPVTGAWVTYDPAYAQPYPYAYAVPYYAPYAYDPFWFSGAFVFCCSARGHHHFRNDRPHPQGGMSQWNGRRGGGMHGGRR